MDEGEARTLTERLLLRPPTAADEEAYLGLFLRQQVSDWLRPAPEPPLSRREVEAMLGDDARHWSDLGFGPWALFDRADDSYLGRVGLRYTAVEAERAIELAWTVDPDRQGEGLATEAGVAAIALARRLEIEAIVALALPRNLASCRVAEKLGMRRDGEVDHAGLPHALYRLALA